MSRYAKFLGLATIAAFGLAGCGEEAGVTQKTEIRTPEGTKTITDSRKVETTGDMTPTPTTTPPPSTPTNP